MCCPIDNQYPVLLRGNDLLDIGIDPHVAVKITGNKSIGTYWFNGRSAFGRHQPAPVGRG